MTNAGQNNNRLRCFSGTIYSSVWWMWKRGKVHSFHSKLPPKWQCRSDLRIKRWTLFILLLFI